VDPAPYDELVSLSVVELRERIGLSPEGLRSDRTSH
jgi:uncharacterized small protein (DUF1192 family)